jgi:hypothetical protein
MVISLYQVKLYWSYSRYDADGMTNSAGAFQLGGLLASGVGALVTGYLTFDGGRKLISGS